MIILTIKKGENAFLEMIRAEGHAEYAEKGKDIVCAAVSVLLQTGFIVMKKLPGIETTLMDNGATLFQLTITVKTPESLEKLLGISDFLFTGLRLIEKNYQDYIKIIEKE